MKSIETKFIKRISIRDCENFVSFFLSKIELVGLMQIFQEYIALEKNELVNQAIKSLYQNLIEIFSFNEALKKMEIQFPLVLEEIFIKAVENSVLDSALFDIDAIFKNTFSEEALLNEMGKLLDKYSNNLKTEFICEGCFLETFEKIIKRAEIETAYKIIFEQEEENFFIQKFIGKKPIKYIEPSHSKTYKTLIKKFEEISQKQTFLTVVSKKIFINKISEKIFHLYYDNVSISISFIS